MMTPAQLAEYLRGQWRLGMSRATTENRLAEWEAAIRADQARKDAGIARQSGRQQFLAAGIVGRDSPCVVSYGVIAAEIERHAGIGEEQKP